MALKYKYAKREEIPAEQAALYVEREGAFVLDAEGVTDKTKADEMRNHNVELRKKIEDFEARFSGIDPEAVRQLSAEKEAAIFAAPIGKVSDPLTVAGDGTYLFLVDKEETRAPDAVQKAALTSTAFSSWYQKHKADFVVTRDSKITAATS